MAYGGLACIIGTFTYRFVELGLGRLLFWPVRKKKRLATIYSKVHPFGVGPRGTGCLVVHLFGRTCLYRCCKKFMRSRCTSGPSMVGLFFSVCPVSYTHLRAHETDSYLVCRLLL